jgi:hypothetical protein
MDEQVPDMKTMFSVAVNAAEIMKKSTLEAEEMSRNPYDVPTPVASPIFDTSTDDAGPAKHDTYQFNSDQESFDTGNSITVNDTEAAGMCLVSNLMYVCLIFVCR